MHCSRILLITLLTWFATETQGCIQSIAGKHADRCACGLGVGSQGNRVDCPTTQNEAPPSSNTIWLPSANSVNLAQVPNLNGVPFVNGGLLPVTIQGVNFDTMQVQPTFCLGQFDAATQRARPCSAGCDAARNQPTATVIAGVASDLFRGLNIEFTNNPGSATSWNARAIELEAEPRYLCWNNGNPGSAFVWTGLRVGAAWSCDDSAAPQACTNYLASAQVYPQITTQQLGIIQRRTTCCRRSAPSYLFPVEFGICINPNTTACCGGSAVELISERCCNTTYETTAFHEQSCPCGNVRNVAPPPGATGVALTVATGGNDDCPFDGSFRQECCLPTKYPELTANGGVNLLAQGQCFNPVKHRCCNTGHRYDPGSEQCCAINGIQSLNVPCPCGADGDCAGGQTRNGLAVPVTFPNVMICCQQTAPVPMEVTGCSIYANYPSGTGPAEIQRCLGRCIDTRYQVCCNGAACIRNYERCCNSTCCNDFVGTCIKGIRAGARGFATNHLYWDRFALNNVQVPVGRNVEFEQCSTVEQIDPINAFWIFVFPAILLAAALLLTATALVFSNKVTSMPLTFLEKLMLFGALLVVVLACAFFFSPVWKYGVVAVLTAVLIILNASTRVRWLNILTLIVVFIVLLYWVDPFSGNAIASFASGRQEPNGIPDYHTSGIFSAIGRHWYNVGWLYPYGDEDMFHAQQYCWRFYNYFMLDYNLRDVDRTDNPMITTFGYCSYQWIVALLFVAAFILLLLLLLLLLVLLAMILRFRKARFEPIELEIVDSDEVPMY